MTSSLSSSLGYKIFLWISESVSSGPVPGCCMRPATDLMKWEIVGRIRRCTLICDIGYPASERRSMSDRSNLYSSFPMELSIESASNVRN